MKSQFARMKTRAKAGSTRTLALVLSFVMLLTVVGSGSVLSVFAQTVKDDAYIGLATQTAAKAAQSVSFGDPEAADPAPADAEDAAAQDAAAPAAQADLSGFAENDLVRGIKADAAPLSREKKDLAGTGANNPTVLYVCLPKSWTENNYTYDIWLRANTNNGWINSTANSDTNQTHHGYRIWSFTLSSGSYDGWSAIYLKGKASASSDHDSDAAATLQLVNTWTGSGNTGGKVNYTAVSGNMNDWGGDYSKYDKNYFLSGYLGKSGSSSGDVNQGSPDYKFTRGTGANINKWTLSYTANGDQYVTVNMQDAWDGYYALHPGSDNASSGAVWTKVDQNYSGSGNNKWKISASSGQLVSLTYDSWTHNLTWTVTTPTVSIYLTGYINGADVDTLTSSNKFTGTSSPYTFTINNSTTDTQYVTITNNSGTVYHPATHGAGSGTAYSTTNTDKRADPKWKVTGCKGKNITFTWDGTKLSWTVSSGGTIDVYAKDGAAPINWDSKTQGGATGTSGTAYNYAIIGTTSVSSSGVTFTNNNCGDSSSAYKYGAVPVGQTITVTTTIGSSYTSTYYVAGWCVNGITYKNGTDTVGVNPSTTSTYSFTYTLPSDTEGMLEDVAGKPVVEITPIYYRKDKTNTVTFFIEGYTDVQSKWGNTPYAYPFYGNLNGYQNTFGAYPGQPVVNVGGQMSIEIPIYSKAIYSKTADGTTIKGVTVNNGYADHVHRNLVYGWTTGSNVNDDKDHMQTYDYDDFYKIWAEHTDTNGDHPNQIFFRFKEETKTYNRSTYGGGNSGQFANSTSNITAAQISTINNNNGWELLKDRHDRPTNLFGDYEAVASTSQGSTTGFNSNALYVISTGYNANIAGDYGTMWKIYDGSNGTLITKDATNARYGIPPSLLHVKGNASSGMTSTVSYPSASRSVPGVGSYTDSNLKYNTIYKALKAAGYNNKVVYITYEKDTQDTRNVATGEGAYRADGQWFYTFATDEVQSTIGIEYYNRANGTWTADTVSAKGVGTTTKATAAFNSDSYLNSSNAATSKKYLTSAGATWNFTATESGTDNKYAFSGWYLKYDDTYEAVTGSTTSGSIKATANYRLIARYVPVTTNSLVITHKLDPESTGTGTATMTVKYNNVTQTVNYVNGVATAEINVSWATSAKNIDVTLTATPQNDGRVKSISVDDQISSYASNTTNYPLPCTTDGRAVTRTLKFTDHDVYNSAGTSLIIDQLDYVSNIDATQHYYEFTYTFNDRGGATKKYTARGEITEDHYAEYVNSSHQVSDAFVKSRAPFESNFLKTLKLGSITKGYTTSTHTLTASATYNATAYTPIYDVKIKLPYNYYTDSSGTSYKKYNANGTTYNASKAAFFLKANYDEFVTIGASDTQAGAQTKVSKVVNEAADPNHTGNNFITAPNTLGNKYFKYWEIRRLADTESAQASAPVIARIYFPDLHYRFYADSYVEAVYTDNENEYWSNVNKDGTNSELSASVLYLESSRNQYNTVANGTSTSAANAADIIYNDFIFNYRLGDQEYISAAQAEVGVVIERVMNSDSTAWVKGSDSVTNMDSYKDANAGTEAARKAAIESWLGGGSAPKGCVKQVWNNSELINKNFTEQNYPVYSQYGQTVSDHSITFTNNNAGDTYVYRAWAYIIDKNNNNAVAVSDPAYFSMNYIAAQNYKD